ncbi:hypothetical protein DFH28DRAFT_931616 [Melampsora americana]|nr:hypothetical protein DFH28DRAFT_931616 [Melampsora americana]
MGDKRWTTEGDIGAKGMQGQRTCKPEESKVIRRRAQIHNINSRISCKLQDHVKVITLRSPFTTPNYLPRTPPGQAEAQQGPAMALTHAEAPAIAEVDLGNMSQENNSQATSSPLSQPAPRVGKIRQVLAEPTPSPTGSPPPNHAEETDIQMESQSNEGLETMFDDDASNAESDTEAVHAAPLTDLSLTPETAAEKLKGIKIAKVEKDALQRHVYISLPHSSIPSAEISFSADATISPAHGDSSKAQEPQTPSQAVRKMKVDKALQRYQKFKAIHENSLKAFKEFQEERKEDDDPDDFYGELELMMGALSLSNQALKKRESKLNEAITDGQDEIEFIPFRNPMPQLLRPTARVKSGRSGGSGGSKGVKRYLDLEAKVSEKEVEEEGCGGRKRRKKEYKSEEFVYDDEHLDIHLGEQDTTDEGSSTSDDEVDIVGPDASQQPAAVVMAEDAIKKSTAPAKKTEKAQDRVIEQLPISKSSIFHNSDAILDVTKLLHLPTKDESEFLRKAASTLTGNIFDWGEALKDSVVGIISCWEYHENSQLGQPTQETIQPLVVLMKRTVEGKEIKKHIETCPRLIQIATTDPYLTENSIEWSLINESTRYPWKDRNRIFRAFHSMACRTGKELVWTTENDIKNKVKTAHKTLHKILEESVDIISYNTKADQIKIQTEGEHKVHSTQVPMSQSIAWAWQQCMIKAHEEKENKSNKVHHQGMSWLQQRFLLILSGVMLVYERDVYNRALERFCKKTPRTPEQITARKNVLKGTILNQLSLDYVRKNPQKALPPSRKNEAQSEEVIKVSEQEIEKAANEETYEFRRLSLQTLALFFMFGTSGLFHVWVWKKEQKMTDAASMIHLSSVLAQRRKNNSSSEPHVFYQRAWSRLDHHMFSILREFITDKGDFKRTLDWPKLTTMFHDRFAPTTLCYLYSLDLCLEIHAPLSTRAPDGSKAPDFDFNQRKKGPALIPITETFKSVWPSTSGEPVPVTDPKQMYIEADGSRVTKNNPLKAITQAKEKARKDKEKEAEGSSSNASK